MTARSGAAKPMASREQRQRRCAAWRMPAPVRESRHQSLTRMRILGVPADQHVLVALDAGGICWRSFSTMKTLFADAHLILDARAQRIFIVELACRAHCRRPPASSTKRMNSGRMTRWPEVKPSGMATAALPNASAVALQQAVSRRRDRDDIHVAHEFGDEFVARAPNRFRCGVPTCTSLPSRMTPMRSDITIASSREWVM